MTSFSQNRSLSSPKTAPLSSPNPRDPSSSSSPNPETPHLPKPLPLHLPTAETSHLPKPLPPHLTTPETPHLPKPQQKINRLQCICRVVDLVFDVLVLYAMDVNVERAEDVLMHKRLLEEVRDPSNRPAFSVQVVQVNDSGIHRKERGDEEERGGVDGYEKGARYEVGSGTGITIPVAISITSPLLMGLG
uniref:Uncharacterized protein n=1 Tax=Ananas comosus var. bracteatus TaxID=296719 RepID=A0A6V7PSA4_ANACO|nr:unnamed protein product [Ananas comosus var. bracteatus]